MLHDLNNEEACYFITWDQDQEASGIKVPTEIMEILKGNEEVFHDLVGLPPSRTYDHAIHIQEGGYIPNLKPYKYLHHQKNEIERLMQEMVQAWIIRSSISPYSSPIILVKKKVEGGGFVWTIGHLIK